MLNAFIYSPKSIDLIQRLFSFYSIQTHSIENCRPDVKRWYATKLAGKFFHKYATTVRVRDEPYRDKDRDGINRMQEETQLRRAARSDGRNLSAVPFLLPRSVNYPEQCRVIKRNAFPDKLQISRWKLAYYVFEEFAFWMLNSFAVLGTIRKKREQFKLEGEENIFNDKKRKTD